MLWWAFAMIAHPEVQRCAQAELDTVVGRSRTPTFSDAPGLPYIQAIVKEVLRWRPVLALAFPHTSTEDDWYEGMFIPKGTLCLTNLWHCHHDPSAYGDDAAAFRPERFLDTNGEIISGPAETREEGHSAYGFGRRACVGKHLANESLFIYIATTHGRRTSNGFVAKMGRKCRLTRTPSWIVEWFCMSFHAIHPKREC
jgi:cytochrome P450